MTLEFIYDTPSILLLFIFIVVFLAIALIGLYIFIILTENFNNKFNDANTGTYLGTVSVAIALIIAFIITNEYQTYSQTASNLTAEANALYSLIQTLTVLPYTENIVYTATQYLCSINTEFVYMGNGQLPPDNLCLAQLQVEILDYIPTNSHDTVLYSVAIDQLNLAINLRNSRLEQVNATIPPELYWLLILGISIVIVLTWFINGNFLYKLIMLSLVTIIYSTLLYLIVILDSVYSSSLGLTSQPFIFIQNSLGLDDCSTRSDGCFSPNNFTKNNLQEKFLKNKIAKCNTCHKNKNNINKNINLS